MRILKRIFRKIEIFNFAKVLMFFFKTLMICPRGRVGVARTPSGRTSQMSEEGFRSCKFEEFCSFGRFSANFAQFPNIGELLGPQSASFAFFGCRRLFRVVYNSLPWFC